MLQQSAENSGSSTSSSGSNYGTLGRGQTGMASMMDEMAKTLARRRAAVEKKEPDVPPQVQIKDSRQLMLINLFTHTAKAIAKQKG